MDKKGEDLGSVLHFELPKDTVEVGLNGFLTYVEPVGNCFIGETEKQQRDNLLFPFGKWLP